MWMALPSEGREARRIKKVAMFRNYKNLISNRPCLPRERDRRSAQGDGRTQISDGPAQTTMCDGTGVRSIARVAMYPIRDVESEPKNSPID
jgi:hypothetical protein